jgi:carnitine-CoA ligase
METAITSNPGPLAAPDPRMPAAADCVLRPLLERRAAETPNQVFFKLPGGVELGFAEVLKETRAVAAGLQQLGVGQGDHVLCLLPNSRECLIAWFAINYLGAVYCPVNTALRGRVLQHVLNTTQARVMVVHDQLLPRVAELELSHLRQLVTLYGGTLAGFECTGYASVRGCNEPLAPLESPIQPWHTQSVIFTSGTTGPSKGVLSSYLHLYTMSGPAAFPYLGPSDRMLVNLPLFHVGGTVFVFGPLIWGGSFALVETFDTAAFWDVVRETSATATLLLGVMAPFLLRTPSGPDDRRHTLRHVCMVPLAAESLAFTQRFGVDVYTCFNMTELNMPVISARNPIALGSCGAARPGVDVRLVDENDCEVPIGALGEMIVRDSVPWALNHGYLGDAEATARAWRNGWFHTGDAFRRDAAGNFYFVDRTKDAIRRRGENVSSFEVEAEVACHPAVREVAAVAVNGDVAEDEILIVVSPAEGMRIDPAELIDFLLPRVAHFMVPRYVRLMPSLPKTPTNKVMKASLRGEGVTVDTWDREKAGIRVRRDRLSAPGAAA